MTEATNYKAGQVNDYRKRLALIQNNKNLGNHKLTWYEDVKRITAEYPKMDTTRKKQQRTTTQWKIHVQGIWRQTDMNDKDLNDRAMGTL